MTVNPKVKSMGYSVNFTEMISQLVRWKAHKLCDATAQRMQVTERDHCLLHAALVKKTSFRMYFFF